MTAGLKMKWRKFDEEDQKGKSQEEQKPRISSDPRKIIITEMNHEEAYREFDIYEAED